MVVGYEYLRIVSEPIWDDFRKSSRNGSASDARAVRGYDCDAGKRAYAAEGGISP